MSTVPKISQPVPEGDGGHPMWCLRDHADLATHRGGSVVVRDRDAIRVEAYLVSYGAQTLLSLDISTPAGSSLVELAVPEARQVALCLHPLNERLVRWRNGGLAGRL